MKKILSVLLLAIFFTASLAALGNIPEIVALASDFGIRLVEQNGSEQSQNDQQAAIFFIPGISVGDLQAKYKKAPETAQKINVLVVPGHEPDYGGAEYRDLKERDMTVELAGYLADLLKANPRFSVTVPRSLHAWNEPFASYFIDASTSIRDFAARQKSEMERLMKSGEIKTQEAEVYHNDAPSDVALRIYGMNKWANDNHVDVAIHIHFNDYPEHRTKSPGEYAGYVIYVPEHQYSNSSTTKAIADSISKRLSRYYPTSNHPQEVDGVVEDQDLIAVGSHNSSDAPSMLIEYGYIYEPQFQNPAARKLILEDLAFQTYLGLQDFFGSGNDVTLKYDNLILPHEWTKNLSKTIFDVATKLGGTNRDVIVSDIIALQTALMREGMYPPKGETKYACPRSGAFGPCTMKALAEFQKKWGIRGEAGSVGEKTRKKLNELYESQML
ncbi:MAG: hypothetical protein JWO73_912 [Candidatus Taylorbacteria bacterium]|nr:hypothetical protein [Candidatus Taylorbacteria bacterium]